MSHNLGKGKDLASMKSQRWESIWVNWSPRKRDESDGSQHKDWRLLMEEEERVSLVDSWLKNQNVFAVSE